MSAYVLVNLLNELGEKIKFNNAGARMQDSIEHITLKWHFIHDFASKRHGFAIEIATFYGRKHITLRR